MKTLAMLAAVLCLVAMGCADDRSGASASPTASSSASIEPSGALPPDVRPDDIAYVKSDHIWVAHSDGSGPRKLTTSSAWDSSPAWSPDHSHIVFVRESDPMSDGANKLCLISVDNGRMKTWRFGPVLTGACCSPDGSRVALSVVGSPSSANGGCPVGRVLVLSLATGKTRLVYSMRRDPFLGGFSLSWSPDGRHLLVGLGRQDAANMRTGVLNLRTGKIVWLKTPGACEAHWAPDGTSLIVTRIDLMDSSIILTDRNGTARRVIAKGEDAAGGEVWGGCYSPDGSDVAYCDETGIWVKDASGGEPQLVIAGGQKLAWSPW